MFSFPDLEQKVLKFWQDNDVFRKSLEKPSPRGNFTFFEGPPTANGRPGVHHVLARAFKDLIPRYKTMQGYHVDRKAGWDTHGLPVELQVEKELKISGKPDIEKYGIEAFNKKCKESVWQFKSDWEKLTERIGFWVDMENPYVTYSSEYVESLWWVFKKIYDRGFLYKGHKVVPHCPRCGTALSSHEVAQGYKLVKENSVYLKFKLEPGQKIGDLVVDDNTYVLSWTTTPWTLPGNVALAVGEKLNYVVVDVKDEKYIIVESLKDKVLGDYSVAKLIGGIDLVGLKYQPLFPEAIEKNVPNYENAYKVYSADFVTTEDGTGVVHTAVMYGEDDYQLGVKVGLPQVHTVDENGNFVISGELNGKFVKSEEVESVVINQLKQNNNLLGDPVPYEHDYPFCWRCSTPLLYYAKDSWFIRVSELRQQMIKANQKISWTPEHIKEGRFGEWLAGAKDWAISRERYWGTPLPIWANEDGELIVVGSYKELAELTGKAEINSPDFDPHRPYIDEIEIVKNGKVYKRVKEVADCWFDSGCMPYAQHHVISDEQLNQLKAEGKFPAQYISEAIDQTRGWFYTLLAVAVLLDQETPYQNVICLGHINDKFGQKMSKSKGNIVDPWEVVNTWGADALRLHLYSINQPGESKNFDIKQVEEVVKKNFMILLNVVSFYKMYAGSQKPNNEATSANHVLDQWLITLTNKLVKDVSDSLDKYDIFSASRMLSVFIDDLSTWYVRRSRDRFKGDDENDRQKAVNTLGWSLLTVAKVLAPFTPFIADHLYQQLVDDNESVHLQSWPVVTNVDEELIKKMDQVRSLVQLGLSKRDEVGIKVRQPLASMTVTGKTVIADNIQLQEIICEELNIKEVKFAAQGEQLTVELDTVIDETLQKEGIIRELVRQVNALRKTAKLTVVDKVKIYFSTNDQLTIRAINEYKEQLFKQTGSLDWIVGETGDEQLISGDCKVNDQQVSLCLVRI